MKSLINNMDVGLVLSMDLNLDSLNLEPEGITLYYNHCFIDERLITFPRVIESDLKDFYK